jgi:hypothetical protein
MMTISYTDVTNRQKMANRYIVAHFCLLFISMFIISFS